MNKRDFFLQAMEAGRFKDKSWLIAAFTIKPTYERDMVSEEKREPWSIYYLIPDDGDRRQPELVCFGDDPATPIELDDVDYSSNDPRPPFFFDEFLTLHPGEAENNYRDEPVEISYGTLLVNYMLLIYPFQGKIPLMEGKIKIKAIEKIIEKRLSDQTDDPNALTVEEYNRYRKATGLLDGLTQLSVPSATEKTMTHHPDTEKRKQELLEQYKGRLDDPTVVATIQEELKKLDQEHLAGDDAEGFYIKDKFLDVARMKGHLMMGREEAFGDADNAEVLTNSLAEGIDVSKMPAMVNSLREGSYDRGSQTQLGGVATKSILRALQNASIEEDDCKSELGFTMTPTTDTQDQFIGLYAFSGTGTEVYEVTEDNVQQLVDKPTAFRSPFFCRTAKSGFCKTCIGRRYEDSPDSLASAGANVGSTFMNIFMKSFHGKALSTVKYRIQDELR